MKKTILLLFSIILSATIYAQKPAGGINMVKVKQRPEQKNSISNYISADTIISFPSETDLRGLVSNQWGNTVMLTTFTTNCKSDTVRLYSINAETFGVDTIHIYIENLRKTLKNENSSYLENIAFNDSLIAINHFHQVYVFKQKNDGYSIYKQFIIDVTIQDLQFLNDSILVMSNNHFSHTPPTYITLFNINALTVEKNIFPHFNNLLLSYFNPQKNFDVNGNTILWVNRAEYSFLIYDNKLQLQDSISQPVKDWKTLSEKTLKKAHKRNKHDAADIIAIVEKEYFHIDQLQWAYIIDSNNIALIHSKPQRADILIDIWTKVDEKWQISQTEIYDFAIKSDTIQRNSFALNFMSNPEVHFVNNNKIVILSRNGRVAEYPIGMPAQEYYQKEWDAWQNNEPFLQITIFSHNFAK